MRRSIGFGYFLLMILPVLGESFLLQGRWRPTSFRSDMIFEIDRDKIVSTSELGSALSMRQRRLEWSPDHNLLYLELHQLEIHQRPSDWYNIKKYARYIGYMRDIHSHGIFLQIRPIPHLDRLHVSVSIGSESLPPFYLERLASPQVNDDKIQQQSRNQSWNKSQSSTHSQCSSLGQNEGSDPQ